MNALALDGLELRSRRIKRAVFLKRKRKRNLPGNNFVARDFAYEGKLSYNRVHVWRLVQNSPDHTNGIWLFPKDVGQSRIDDLLVPSDVGHHVPEIDRIDVLVFE